MKKKFARGKQITGHFSKKIGSKFWGYFMEESETLKLMPPYSKRENFVIKFKMGVRKRMPRKLRNATVCRACVRTTNISDKCLSCKIENAINWGRAY